MPHDAALQLLQTELSTVDQETLWYADENVTPLFVTHLFESISPSLPLTIVTNRYDIYQSAQKKHLKCIFTDFNCDDYNRNGYNRDSSNNRDGYSSAPIKKIIYRISKEKALTHYLLNQASQLLANNGDKNSTLIISGYKQEGIKSYSDKLIKQMHALGNLKKSGNAYLGRFTFKPLQHIPCLDDQNYAKIQTIPVNRQPIAQFYSKPGIFGWNKIDRGTELLLEALQTIYSSLSPAPKTVLDIGCGYGWIFLNLDRYDFSHITATDNNAAALICAQKNTALITTPVRVVASDCANTITSQYDLVLCNPPFHKGFQHNQQLTEQFINSCHAHTLSGGICLVVVNTFINIEKHMDTAFEKTTIIKRENGFKVILFEK